MTYYNKIVTKKNENTLKISKNNQRLICVKDYNITLSFDNLIWYQIKEWFRVLKILDAVIT